jgi:hypothetical protein
MPSATYQLFRKAILSAKQITCDYQGNHRELCPIILGHTLGRERALVFHSAVRAVKACRLAVIGMSRAFAGRTREDGRWHEDGRHSRPQACVEEVDLGINIHERKRR